MISKRAKGITSFMVMDVMAKTKEMELLGEDVVHLEVGEPDFDTPRVIQDTAVEAMRSGKTHYTHAMGMIELREAVCEHYFKEYNVTITPDQVLITSGTSPGMLLMMLAIIESGDEIILSDPHYACYPNFIKATGGQAIAVRTYPEEGFQYRPEEIKKALTPKTKGIIINSPSNPTGIVMTKRQLEQIAEFEKQFIISDEIYHGLVYRGKAHSILEFTDKAFVINGFSKLFAMTGWRLGYVIFPKPFSSVMDKMHQNFMISANSFVQLAGITALKESWPQIEKMKQVYNKRRVYMVDRLRELGFKIHVEPTGAFYVFADAKFFCSDSLKEAFNIVEKAKVGVTPGVDFGKGGEGFLRFSYANSIENIKKGLDRIEAYLLQRPRL